MNPATMPSTAWRDELVPVDDYQFRKAYQAQGTRLSQRDRAALADVIDLVAWWNKRMTRPGKGGRNKIRTLDLERFRAVRDCLQVFTADMIAAAIDRYSRREWNLKTGAYKKPINFFRVSYLAELVDEIESEREKAAAAKPIADRRVRSAVDQVAAATAEPDPWAALNARYNGLKPAERDQLKDQAASELVSLGRPRRRLTPFEIDRQAMIILNREGTHQ